MMFSRRMALLTLASAAVAATARSGNAAGPTVVVSKDPNCGCCVGWAEHLRAAGFTVDLRDVTDLGPVKTRLGVPGDLASCHTAEVGGYVIEGHVPASAIRRLLDEKPQAKGLAVPGMPTGSPGMEVPGSRPEEYAVILFGDTRRTYARFKGATELPTR
ncbi:MAG: DUF411 domain-containing protein [Xanthobacteraceae bacterium]|nr:DUF411 domain-containing protein [Xanthobacteraceae bacterium]